MPRGKYTKPAPGTVKFLGLPKVLRIGAPSGVEYVFKKGEQSVVRQEDWEWLESIMESRTRFEIIVLPVIPEVFVSTTPEIFSGSAVVAVDTGGNMPRDLPEKVNEQN